MVEKFIMIEFVQGNLNTKRAGGLHAYTGSEEAEHVSRTG